MTFEEWFWRIVGVLAASVVVAGVCFVIYAIVMSARADGRIDYCYIEMWSPSEMAPQYRLKGHRSWRDDRLLGTFVSIDEAKTKADLMGCSVAAGNP